MNHLQYLSYLKNNPLLKEDDSVSQTEPTVSEGSKEFKNKDEVVDALVNDFGKRRETFYNTPTNKNIEKFYTFNRTLRYYYDLKSGKKK